MKPAEIDKRLAQELRANLPEILHAEDLRLLLGVASTSAALRRVKAGDCGPSFRLGRRVCVRREAFLGAMAMAEAAAGDDSHLDGA